jgi:hypothetical protein
VLSPPKEDGHEQARARRAQVDATLERKPGRPYDAVMGNARLPEPDASATDGYYDNSRPSPSWEGVVRYYGALVAREGWREFMPVFELVKQISTSSATLDFVPSIVNDRLLVARQSLDTCPGPEPALEIDVTPCGKIRFRQYAAHSSDFRSLECPHASAFAVFVKIVASL